jgi:uncharacterized lipoprotein YmbA
MNARPALAALVLAGCSLLTPQPDRTRFYVLTALTDGAPPAGASFRELPIGLGPVTLPSYLDRSDLATRVGPHQIAYSPSARWAESLHANFVRVLARDLEHELGDAMLITFPWFGATRLAYVAEVDVQRFECDEAGTASLTARWTIRDAATRSVIAADSTQLTEAAGDPDTAAAVAALSRTLSSFARELATSLRHAQQAHQPRPATRGQRRSHE